MFTFVHMLIFAALRGIIMFDKIPMFKRSIPGKEMHFHACTYWKRSVLEGERIMKSVPCSIDMFSSRTQCITCLHILGCSWKTICTYMHVHVFKYRRIAQVLAVAFTIHFPNEWTNNIKQSRGSWGCCKFGPGMPWPFQSAGVWWLWIRCVASPNGDTMVTPWWHDVILCLVSDQGRTRRSMTQYGSDATFPEFWDLGAAFMHVVVAKCDLAFSLLNRLNIRNSLAKEF